MAVLASYRARPWRVAALLFVSCAVWCAPPSGIEGTVVSRETGQPLAGVHVSFSCYRGARYGAISDEAGHFSITGMAADSYTIRAAGSGLVYLPPMDKGEVRDSVNLQAGDRLPDLKIEMTQWYVITGRVVDENGDPLQSVLVGAQAESPNDRPLPPGGPPPSVLAGDRGEFQLSLAPGKYYIRATPLGGLDNQPEIHTDGSSGAPYERTYYPSAPDKVTAIPVTVPADDDSSPLVIHLGREAGPLPVPPAADGKQATLRGVVSNAISRAPLRGVHISLWAFETQRKYGAITDADGKFSISGMPEGSYGILTTRAGFVAPPGLTTSVEVRATDQTPELRLQLTPTGTITGRVTDVEGKPVEFATVYANGGLGWYGSDADGEGRFRIGGLRPGSYRLGAARTALTPPGVRPEIRTDGTVETHNGPTYLAGAIDVSAGSETGNHDIRLARTRLVQVSGKVTGVPQGAQISLLVEHGGGGFSGFPNSDGTFEWWFDPGKYVISAHEGSGPVLDGMRTAASVPTLVTVGDANIDGLDLRILPASDIQGHVEYETPGTQPAGAERWLRLMAMEQMSGGASPLTDDGAFNIVNLPAGRYRVTCDWAPKAYVKSMRLASDEIQGDILDLRNGSAGAALTVVVSPRFGRISGVVQGERPAAAGLKVALLDIRPEYAWPLQFADIGADGRYSFDAVTPGDYKLGVAGENEPLVQGAYAMAEYDPVVETFDTVTVRAGENTASDLKTLKWK